MFDHPEENYGSANSPAILHLGYLYNSNYTDNRLKTEIWIPDDLFEKNGVNAQIMAERVRSGDPMEVSTAYWADKEFSSGIFKGEEYYAIQRNLRPDHVALLLDGEGKCNLDDGCGFPRNEKFFINAKGKVWKEITFNVRDTARTPAYDGVEETSWGDVDKSFGAFVEAYYDKDVPEDAPSEDDDLTQEQREWMAEKSLLGEVNADTWRDLVFFPVVNPNTERLNRGALVAVLGGRGSQADIPEDTLDSAQSEAQRLLDDEFEDEDTEENMDELKGLRKIMAGWGDALTDWAEGETPEPDDEGATDENSRELSPELQSLIDEHGEEKALELLTADPDEDQDPDPLMDAINEIGEAEATAILGEKQEDEEKPEKNESSPCAELQSKIKEMGGEEAVLALLEEREEDEDEEDDLDAERNKKIERILANESMTFTREELEATDPKVIDKLHSMTKGVDFSGRGEDLFENESDLEIPRVLLAE